MYEDEPTYRDPLDTIEDLLAIREHSPRFWDADTAEQATTDPYDHPSWDVADALAEDGWDDPAAAIEVRELLAGTLTAWPLVRDVDQIPVLVSVDGSGLWPAAGDYGEEEVWAA
ncbi:hypothetical protein [Nocardiopsis sp. NRRL B-16309]|uniref:hypothetical protein n=1 Tax=Nocardiopsis sp. NRRL B-16309 TaxID=1519494 RepID=UPI0006AFFAE0|nr:hypothetical protein [Nocardiopsis sp. NRRL B-16309]